MVQSGENSVKAILREVTAFKQANAIRPEAPQGLLPDEVLERRLVTPRRTAFVDSDTAYQAYEDNMRDYAEIVFNYEQDHPSIFGFGEIEVLRRELHYDIGQMEIKLRTIFA